MASAVVLFGWLTGTLVTAAGRLNNAVGASVPPTTLRLPSQREIAESLWPVLGCAGSPARLSYAGHRAGPDPTRALVVQGPARPAGPVAHAAVAATGRVLARAFPAFAIAAVVVEIARHSYGGGQLLGRGSRLTFPTTRPRRRLGCCFSGSVSPCCDAV
jgi:hypothetical protein